MLTKDLALYLQANAIGTLGVNIRFGDIAYDIDNMVFILEDSGENNINSTTRYFKLRVLVRNKSYVNGTTLANSIYNLCHNKIRPFTGVSGIVSTIYYTKCEDVPTYLSMDTQGRYHWEVTVQLLGKL